MTDGPKFVKGMTNQELITKLSSLPASAPVGVHTPESKGGWDLVEATFDGEYVKLRGGNPNE